MKAVVSRKGQLVLPASFREREGIAPGEQFDIHRISRSEFRLSRKNGNRVGGIVDWLLACPEKGFFAPIESESTDTL
jgi:AbrB family looped-hinge helix DNA binding protein